MGRLIEKPEKAVVTMEKPEKGSVTMETLHQNERISLAERRISLFSFASACMESPWRPGSGVLSLLSYALHHLLCP